jgi:hypothetical protein
MMRNTAPLRAHSDLLPWGSSVCWSGQPRQHAASRRGDGGGQENVALQVAEQMADYLLTGAVVNSLNMPNVSAEDEPKHAANDATWETRLRPLG